MSLLRAFQISRRSVYCSRTFLGEAHSSVRRNGGNRYSLVRNFSDKTPVQSQGAPPPTTITFVEGAKTASQLGLLLGIGGLVITCGFLIIREVMPTRLSPNSVFTRCFNAIKDNEDVKQMIGTNIRGYGRDFHQSKEGRRNFVDSDKYVDLDGNKRIRVRFSMEGSKGKMNVYTEVADEGGFFSQGKQKTSADPLSEFSYIILEQYVGGARQTMALVDNRVEPSREELQEKIAKRLKSAGATLFGSSNCQYTQRQLVEFGDFAKDLNTVMCDREENKAKCEAQQLQGYPTWVLNSEQLPGFYPLESLKDMVTHM